MLWNILSKNRKKPIASVGRKILRTKILLSEELNKIDKCFYQAVLFVVRKNQGSLKIKKLAYYGAK